MQFPHFNNLLKVYKKRYGSNREQLEILKEELLYNIAQNNLKSYEKIHNILQKHEKIEHVIVMNALYYQFNRSSNIMKKFEKEYGFKTIIMNEITENKNDKLLEFLRSKEYDFVKGFHIKGVRRKIF